MSRNIVLLIWGFGALLDHVLADAAAQLQLLADRLDGPTMEAVRGLAIALFCVFLALCLVALRRGQPAVGMAVVVSLVFLLLAGHVFAWVIFLHRPHWVLALLLALFASLTMTRRVLSPASM